MTIKEFIRISSNLTKDTYFNIHFSLREYLSSFDYEHVPVRFLCTCTNLVDKYGDLPVLRFCVVDKGNVDFLLLSSESSNVPDLVI